MIRMFRRIINRFGIITLYIAATAISSPALTQENPAPGEEQQGLNKTVEELKNEIETLRLETATLKKTSVETTRDNEKLSEEVTELRRETADLKESVEMIENAQFEDFSDETVQDKLSVYGFFDFTFGWMLPYEDSIFDGLINDNPTFMVNSVNLYFRSQMTDSLSVLAELRFTFDPLGQETSLEFPGLEDQIPYERVDTSVENQFNKEMFQLGGVGIERVQLTYRPFEWFGVIAGRYITPSGIWNVDHGAPVLITIRNPFMHTCTYIPHSQMGIQLFGRFIPKTFHYVNWAFTVSNGRGPADTLVDFDKNKGLGFRLDYDYETADFRFRLGGYGYMGDFTDHKKILVSSAPFNVDTEITEKYTEYVGELDVLAEFFRIRLQGEFMRGRINYDDDYRVLRSQSLGVGYQPDYVYTDFYGLIGYILPLDKWLGSMKIMPYFLYEYSDQDDSVAESLITHILIGGINFKPSPYIVLKIEYTQKLTPAWEDHAADFHVVAAQLAVSF